MNFLVGVSLVMCFLVPILYCYMDYLPFYYSIPWIIILCVIWLICVVGSEPKKSELQYPRTESIHLDDGCTLTRYWESYGNLTKYVRCPNYETTTYTTKFCGKHCTREESITTKEEK